MAFFSSFLKSFYGKALFAIVLGAFGIVFGVKVAYTYFLKEKTFSFAGPQSPPQSSLSFTDGEPFPREVYTTSNGDTGSFEQLLEGKESIVICVDLGCPTCLDLMALWHTEVQKELRSGIQQIAMLPSSDSIIPSGYALLFESFKIVYYDRTYWAKKYKKTFTPIVIGIDKNGAVTYQQFGFRGYLEYPLVNRYCGS